MKIQDILALNESTDSFGEYKLSDVIKALEKIKAAHGDLSCATLNRRGNIDTEAGAFGSVQEIHAYNQKQKYVVFGD